MATTHFDSATFVVRGLFHLFQHYQYAVVHVIIMARIKGLKKSSRQKKNPFHHKTHHECSAKENEKKR